MNSFTIVLKKVFIFALVFICFKTNFGQISNKNILSTSKPENKNYSSTDLSYNGIYSAFKPSDEILELRDRTSKHFRNPDGTVTAIISSGQSLNYNENGEWKSISREIKLNNSERYYGYGYANTSNIFKSYFSNPGTNNGVLTNLAEGDIIDWLNPEIYYLVNGEKVNINKINTVEGKINDNVISYIDCFYNIDIKFKQENDGMKMNIILKNIQSLSTIPINATYFVFEETAKLPDGWNAKETDGCINIYDGENKWIARYEKPFYFDSNIDTLINEDEKKNNSYLSGNFNLTKEGNLIKISMLVPVEWLKNINRKFPVTLDPTISIYPTNSTFYTGRVEYNSTLSTYTKYNDSIMTAYYWQNGPNYIYSYGFLKFDIGSIANASSISSATINYYNYSRSATATSISYIYPLTNDPVSNSVTPQQLFTDCSDGALVASGYWQTTPPTWYYWGVSSAELTNIFNRINSPGWVGYGIVSYTTYNWYKFYGYGNSSYKPYLSVTYCVTPGSPVSLSSSVTGQTTAAISWAAGTPSGSTTLTYYWEVYTTGGLLASSGNTTNLTANVSGLTCGTTYYFRVQAKTSCDNSISPWALSSNFITTACCVTPAPPDTLNTTITSQTTANINWTAGTPSGSPSITYYWEVYSSGGLLVTSNYTTGTQVSVSSLSCETSYYFQVRAYTSCGGNYSNWAISNIFVTYPCDFTVPSSGSNLNFTCSGHVYDNGGSSGNYADNSNGYSVIYPGDTTKALQLSGTYNTEIYDTIKIYYGSAGIGGTLAGSFAGVGSIPTITSSGANVPLTISFVSNGSVNYSGFDFIISCVTPCSASSVTPVVLATDRTNYCSDAGGNITLSSSGGNGNTLFWYKGNCAGISVGTGNPLILNAPTVSVVYYASWYISGCTNSSCKSVTVLVITAPVAPVSARVDTNNYCSNYSGTINLSASGGSGTKLVWYTTSCGGTQIGTGISLTLPAPTFSISYYTNWQTVGCNNTTCVSINLNVLIVPSAPIIAMTDRNNFCSNAGGNISLSVSGGNGINVGWYRVSCGGTLVGSGNPKVLTAPTSSITYWARWESTCGNSTCASVYITVLPLSVAPVSVSVDRNNLCTNDGGNINLSSSGGSGVSINWFTASCGGTAIGTGKIYTTPTPTTTTTYWVRWTNTCGNSTCKSIIETIFSLPSPPVTVSSDRNNFCSSSGGSVTLSSSGGTGIMLSWYGISCNYGAIGTGNTLIINAPTTTSTYWVNWQSAGCANSTCISVTVTVISGTITPVSALSDRDTICANDGSTINLSVSGGLGTTVGWYTVSCGGTLIGTGNPINLISPTITTTYWANRQSSGCTNSSCISLTEIVNPAPIAPLSLSSDNNNFCLGSVTNITLSTSGGSGTASQWSLTSCGGTIIGTGNQIIISAPSSNTVYYNWWQIVGCNNSSCLSISIVLNSNTTIPTTVTAVPLTVCPGTASVLTETGGTLGTGANWYWYSGTCGGTLVGTSNITTQYPTTSTTYWIRGQGLCNTTGCLSRRVLVSTAISSVTLTGSASVCPGSSQTYYATLYAGYVYTWSAPTGWTGTSTSNSIVFIIGTTPGLVSVIPSNTCGTGAVSSKYVSLNDTSVTPTSLAASPSGICLSGSGSTITLNGGYLGTGGIWKWYSGSCGVTSSGTGISVTKNPTVNTVYWVRAEGTCNSTHCLSVTITINSSSTIAVSVNASPSTICNGSQSTLTETGGVLGTGANWYWYSGSCGGIFIGTNSTLTQNPTITSTYYVRAEGTCNTTVCLSVTINVNNVPLPVGLISGVTTACSGSIQTYSVSLTTGITYNWSAPVGWTGASMSNSIMYTLGANSGNITFTPSNSCGNGVASSIYVNVNTFSVVPTSVNASPSNVCPGSPTTLTETGGTLGSGANWYWYSGSCGGSASIGTGSAIILNPTVTTTYQVRAEGTCNTTTCWIVNVTVNTSLSSVPVSVSASPSSMCTSGISTLTETGGILGTGSIWRWYTGSCGGLLVGTGISINQNITTTTFYYVRAEGICNTTLCLSVSVNLIPIVSPNPVIATPSTICLGSSSSLNATSTGNTITWWTAASGGTLITTTASGLDFVVSPTISTTYYVEAGQYSFYSQTFLYSGTYQTFIVPSGVTSINVDASGAQGGVSSNPNTYGYGGLGGRMQTNLNVTGGQTLYFYVGGQPASYTSNGGFNGGANGSGTMSYYGGSGGGASDIRVSTLLSDRLIVAAGGGGAGYGNGSCAGGAGGGLTGGNGLYNGAFNSQYCGGGGTQTSGGTGGSYTSYAGSPGTLGAGGVSSYYDGGGGGGGYYGGGGGAVYGGGGGGSSWVNSLLTTGTVNTSGYQSGNGQIIIGWYLVNCVSSARSSVTVTVNFPSISATNALANPSIICNSGNTTLTENGGFLGNGAAWNWYTGSCGGTLIGTGATINQSITANVTYYVRSQGICNTTSCQSASVSFSSISVPNPVSANPSNICPGASSSLSAVSSGNSISWWYVLTGGTILGSSTSGNSFVVTPTTSITYYAEADYIVSQIFNYTGSYQMFAVPLGTSSFIVDASGAQGSISSSSSYGTGGLGGRIQTTLTVTPGQTLYFYVGGQPATYSSSGGYNGGGDGSGVSGYYGGSGGGASDIRTSSLLTDRLIVAGGGGGSGYGNGNCSGGVGGGLNAGNGSYGGAYNPQYCGAGGTQTSGGAGATGTGYTGNSGTLGNGGAANYYYGPGGGGGGYYGGGGGGNYYGGGGGGSSWVNSSLTSGTTHTQGYQTGNGQISVTWLSTLCTSSRRSITVTLNTNSSAPTSVIASATTICSGNSITLSQSGGVLGTNANFYWYSGLCGGTFLASGSTLIQIPTNSTVYYVRAEGVCNTTNCINQTINVYPLPIIANTASSDINNFCSNVGGNINLSVTGGFGTKCGWYTGSCGGTIVGTGNPITLIVPTITTTYYARWETALCGNSLCKTITTTVIPAPIAPYSLASSLNNFCSNLGGNITLSTSGGSGSLIGWFTGNCNGTNIGTGNSLTLSAPILTTTYYANWQIPGCANSTCASITISVIQTPTNPFSVSATPVVLGIGQSSNLIVNGSLISGAVWKWYGNNCGSGTIIGTGSSIIVNPLSSITYFVRGENGNCYSNCLSASVTLLTNLNGPGTLAASNNPICPGQSSQLGLTGILNGGQWYWYLSSCGGTLLGTGSVYIASPTFSTTYYVRQELGATYSSCNSIMLNVYSLSSAAISASSSPTSICSGNNSILSLTGGSLGDGGNWNWYTGFCGGTFVGSGSIKIVNPTTTTTYYTRAEGNCNTSLCVSTVITVFSLSSSPNSALAAPAVICSGAISTLNVAGGLLGTGASWFWYNSNCGGIYVISGAIPVISPTITTTYYVRAEGTCNTSICVSTTITVNTLSFPATTANATLSVICSGSSSILSISGGTLGTGAGWYWYNANCGGIAEGNGSTLNVSPTNTTNYYIRAEGICNTTLCVSITITVNSLSLPASSAIATISAICTGSSSTLGITGGSLGTSGIWSWYSGTCGGNAEGQGNTLIVSPIITTNYFVRAEGTCNSTSCKSTTITVNINSTSADSASANPSTVCEGNSSILSADNGSLGTGANWFWYSGSCGGTFEGNGSAIAVIPILTTDYYVRAEGLCNTTLCEFVTISVNSNSVQPDFATASEPTICEGSATTLGISGGSLGTGADWYWYSGSCGGYPEGNGISLIANPSITTNYYVRAEGICNTTTCLSTTITVNSLSSNSASSITVTSSSICSGGSTTLGISGGSLGTGADWYWYSGTCGGSPEGNGNSIIISPAATTNYYVRAEGICNTTTCLSTTITVNSLSSNSASSVTATSSSICLGGSTTLGISGGNLGTGADWYWYSGSCGGYPEGNGISLIANPSITTNYYVRAEGICNTTNCLNTTITVNSLSSISASTITATSSSICLGGSTTLGISGGSLGTGADWYWYSGSCGGNPEGNGISLITNPSITTNYYVRAEGICNTTTCLNTTITVNSSSSISASSITATLSSICIGDSTTLGISGGSLGTGADWYWYSGSCGGNPEGNGISLVANPSITTNYYVRAEGICNTTTCLNTTITVNSLSSISASSVTATLSSICSGGSTTLGISGGSLGTGADWYWYGGSCGGNPEGNGISLVANPSITTNYYVRAEGICNTTTCLNSTITVNYLSSISASTVTATLSSICLGGLTTLGINGGSLGTGADWYWYSGSCGGNPEGNGISLIANPSITTNYYVRAEGICNTTTCLNTTITVNSLSSISASTVTATLSSICSGDSTTLGISGGSLGTGADWYWYSGTCGGIPEGNGIFLIANPSITTNYYVRAEGTCNITNCLNTIIDVNTLSSTSTSSVTSTLSSICSGDSTTLGINGGSLGTGADWYWYSGTCGGTPEGNGNLIIITPSITTNYYVRAEGTCNTTTCSNIIITISDTSTNSTSSVTATLSTICEGSSTTLGITGGFLGTGADWYWYSGTCGGSFESNGNSIIVSPSINTDYFIRAEGICNTTLCLNINIVVNSSSSVASYIFTTNNPITYGASTTLGISGGNLGTNADWYWYSVTCGGTPEGNGSTITVGPTITTDYYLRAEGICNTTSCVNITITVNDSSISASSVTATLTTICTGDSSTLGIVGGVLGTNANWFWYEGSCGNNLVGNDSTLLVSPGVTTDYFVRAEGLLNTTICIDIIISVSTTSVLAVNIISTKDTINSGTTDTLSISDGILGTGANWYWYIGSCGGNLIGNGTSVIVSPNTISVYYIRAEGSCNTTGCISKVISILNGYTISGTLLYDQSNVPLDSVWLYLKSNGSTIDSTQSDINGLYQFNMVQSRVYTIDGLTKKPWGGVNATDAVKVKRHFAGSELFTTSLRLHAADVNLSMGINTTDAVKITRRFVGSDTSFARGDWDFEKPFGGDTLDVSTTLNDTIIVSGSNVEQAFKGICIGDVNGSNVPTQGAKSSSKISIDYIDFMRLNSNDYFELPLKVTSDIGVGAISLIMNYPEEFVSITNVQCSMFNENNNLVFNTKKNELRIGWFASDFPINLKNNESLIIISGKITGNFNADDVIKFGITNNPLCEIADEYGNPIDNVVLNTYKIENSNSLDIQTMEGLSSSDLFIYPNPAENKVNIRYNIANDGFVKISLFNILGEKIIDIVNKAVLKGSFNSELNLSSIQSGVYTIKMILSDNIVTVKRLVISK